MARMKQKNNNITVVELKKICKEKGIKGYSKMRKSELLKICLKKTSTKKPIKKRKIVKKSKKQKESDKLFREIFLDSVAGTNFRIIRTKLDKLSQENKNKMLKYIKMFLTIEGSATSIAAQEYFNFSQYKIKKSLKYEPIREYLEILAELQTTKKTKKHVLAVNKRIIGGFKDLPKDLLNDFKFLIPMAQKYKFF